MKEALRASDFHSRATLMFIGYLAATPRLVFRRVGLSRRCRHLGMSGAVDCLDEAIPDASGSKVVANGRTEEKSPDSVPAQVLSRQQGEMVRPGRFELPTLRFVV